MPKTHEINGQRQVFGEYHHLFPSLKRDEQKFHKYMKMKSSTFEYILSKVESFLIKNWGNFQKQPILPEEKLVLTIRFIATGLSYSDLAFTFRMGESTVCSIIKETTEVLWNVLCHLHMPVPTKNDFHQISKDFFLRWNFLHCLGAIDCQHIRIKKPPRSGSLYFNYKKFFSIVLQAVVDSNYKFIAIDVRGFGYQHDTNTLRASSFYHALQQKQLELPEEDALPNSKTILPYFFIGDGAYPLSDLFMKPYPGKNLQATQEQFNKRLSRARIVVECAFGIMCQKWRIFFKTIQQTTETTEMIVKTAFILHNVIIDLKGCNHEYLTNQNVVDEEAFVSSSTDIDEVVLNFGQEIREELKKYFMEHPLNQ